MYKTVKFKKLVNVVRIKVEFLYREKLDTYTCKILFEIYCGL